MKEQRGQWGGSQDVEMIEAAILRIEPFGLRIRERLRLDRTSQLQPHIDFVDPDFDLDHPPFQNLHESTQR